MTFRRVKYELDNGLVARVRLSLEEIAVAGTEPATAVDLPITAYASGSRRRFGVHTRGVNLVRTVTDGALTVTFTKFLTLLTPAAAALPANQPGQVITIDGVNWSVDKLVGEELT